MDRQQLRKLSPPDAAVALRSYARRAGELFRPGELDGGDPSLDRQSAAGWSVTGLLQSAQAHLAALQRALAEVAHQDQPTLPGTLFERPSPDQAPPPSRTAPRRQALEQLGATLAALADQVAGTPLRDWARTARVGEQDTDAHELLREAVAFGRSALDELAVTLNELRR